MLRWQMIFRGVCLGALGLVVAGCSSSESSPRGNASSPSPQKQTAQTAPSSPKSQKTLPQQDPKHVVEQFLQATKQGDKQKVRSLMTTKAVQEMEKHNRSIDPQGSPSATYKVVDSELVEEGAHVLVHWIDGPQQQQRTTKMIWVLKPEKDQWRVAGVIIKLFEDLPPVPFDFEDPEDMEAKEQYVAEEFRRRAAKQAQTTKQGAEAQAAGQQSGKQPPASEQTSAAQTAGATTPGQKRR